MFEDGKFHKAVESAVVASDCQLWAIEQSAGGPRTVTVCVYIDREENGDVTVVDCARVSRQISAVLAVEMPDFLARANVQVSSPGVERRLFSKAHYQRFLGNKVRLRLKKGEAINNRRHYQGLLAAVDSSNVTLQPMDEGHGVDQLAGIPFVVPISSIECAHLLVY